MKIKKFKFLLCIPIACFFVGALRGFDCKDYRDIYNECEDTNRKIRACRNDCARCNALNASYTHHVDCTHDCNCAEQELDCSPRLDAYNNCLNNLYGGGDTTGSNNTGVVNGTTCDNPPSSDGECGDGYEMQGECCVEIYGGTTCDNPPSSDGECEDGYEMQGDCCVKASCESQTDCGEGKVWSSEKCKCICDSSVACCGVQLNTVVPFIGDCIELTSSTDTSQGLNQLTAFPYLMKGLSKIVVTIIMILSIIIVIAAGLMMTTSVASTGNYDRGLKWLGNVIKALILLGTSGLILRLINPTFFGG